MKNVRWCISLATVALVGLVGTTLAAEPLTKQQVIDLISGAKVTERGHDPTESGGRIVQYEADGRASQSMLGRKRGYVETGTWKVNDKGQLCVQWQGESKLKCVYLVPTGRDTYYMTNDPAKQGKLEIVGVSK
jgi:hypothetical protein